MQLTPWNGPFGKAGWGGGGGWGGAVTAHKILISQQIKWTSRYSEPCCLIGSMCSAWWFTKTHTHHGIHTVWHIFSIYGMHTADSMHMPTVCTCARTVVCTYTPWQAHSMACTHTMASTQHGMHTHHDWRVLSHKLTCQVYNLLVTGQQHRHTHSSYTGPVAQRQSQSLSK